MEFSTIKYIQKLEIKLNKKYRGRKKKKSFKIKLKVKSQII